jgi:hypothetical protein
MPLKLPLVDGFDASAIAATGLCSCRYLRPRHAIQKTAFGPWPRAPWPAAGHAIEPLLLGRFYTNEGALIAGRKLVLRPYLSPVLRADNGA